MRIIFSSLVTMLVVPALVLAHGAGEHHGAGDAHLHIGVWDVAIGLGIIAAIAIAWALLKGKKE
jgi:hypothetical protein